MLCIYCEVSDNHKNLDKSQIIQTQSKFDLEMVEIAMGVGLGLNFLTSHFSYKIVSSKEEE